MSETRATDALNAEIDTMEEAQRTFRRVIARKKVQGKGVSAERHEMARLSRRIGHAHDVVAELEAGRVVVSAPSREEVAAARRHARAVRDIATQDAMTRSGFNVIRNAIAETRETSKKVKKQ